MWTAHILGRLQALVLCLDSLCQLQLEQETIKAVTFPFAESCRYFKSLIIKLKLQQEESPNKMSLVNWDKL